MELDKTELYKIVYSYMMLGVVPDDKRTNDGEIFFSVPEHANVTIDGKKYEYTGVELAKKFKNDMLDGYYHLAETSSVLPVDDEDREFIKSHIKFFGKIRGGEVWKEEYYNKVKEELVKKIEEVKKYNDGYEEI